MLPKKGTVPLPILLAVIGIISFLAIATTLPLKDQLSQILYPKPASQAAETIIFPPNQVGLKPIPIQPMSMPPYLQTVKDPTLGNFVTRISDQGSFNTTNKYLTHSYSKVTPWNADESLIFLTGWNWNTGYLLDGQTGAYLRTVHPGSLGGQSSRWSNVNPNNMYGIPSTTVSGGACNTTNRLVVWHPKTDTKSSPTLTVLHTFTKYDSYADTTKCANMSFGIEEGNFSNDDSLGAVIGWSSAQNSWGITTFQMTDVTTDTPKVTEIATHWLGAAGGTTNNPQQAAWNNISATPKGDGVIIQWNNIGPGPNQGIEWFNKNLTVKKHIMDSVSHYDLGLSENGTQMVITPCGQPGGPITNLCKGVSQSEGPPFMAGYYFNENGPTGTPLNLLPYSPNLAIATHTSCRNQFKRPGWCYISDFQNNPALTNGNQQIYALKLDGSKTTQVFAVDHGSHEALCNTCNQYTARAVPNRDGTRILFGSDWGAGLQAPSYAYLTWWPQPQPSPPPPPASKTYYVDAQNGNDDWDGKQMENPNPGLKKGPWKTIKKANLTVSAGDTVLLKGTFNTPNADEPIWPRNSGTANAYITYKSYPGQKAVLYPHYAGTLLYWAYIRSEVEPLCTPPQGCLDFKISKPVNYIRIEDLEFKYDNYKASPLKYGIRLLLTSHNIIKNNSSEHGNMAIEQSDDNTIEGNRMREYIGTYDDPTTDIIETNHPMSAGDLIMIQGSTKTKILQGSQLAGKGSSRNKIINNNLSYAGHSVISIAGTPDLAENADNIISGNTLSNPWYTIMNLGRSGSGIIENNIFKDAGTAQAQDRLFSTVGDPKKSTTYNRPVTGASPLQLSANYSSIKGYTIRYNTFTGNNFGTEAPFISAAIGIGAWYYYDGGDYRQGYINESIGNKIYHNLIYNNTGGYGIKLYRFFGDSDLGKPETRIQNNLIANNIFFNNSFLKATLEGKDYYPAIIFGCNDICNLPPNNSLDGNKFFNNIFLRKPGTQGEFSVYYENINKKDQAHQRKNIFTLSRFEQTYPNEVKNNSEQEPQFINPVTGDFHLKPNTPGVGAGFNIAGVTPQNIRPNLGLYPTQPAPTPAPSPSPNKVGDISGPNGIPDGKVDIDDYNAFIPQFDREGNNLSADFDKNGVVDIDDYNIFIQNSEI